MLYVIENKRTGELITGTDYASGKNKSGYLKQLYNTEYHAPLIFNDGNCAGGLRRIALEIRHRGINMDTHRLKTLYLDVRECKSRNKEIKEIISRWDEERELLHSEERIDNEQDNKSSI